jgi:hypothetical protein
LSYAEILAIPDDYSESELGNDETENMTTDETSTPTPHGTRSHQPSPAQLKPHDLNVNYVVHYMHKTIGKNGQEVNLLELLQHNLQHNPQQSVTSVGIMMEKAETVQEPKPQNKRKLVLSNKDEVLRFTALDISEPPNLKYSDDLDQLVQDWEESSYIFIKGVPIALKHWSKVYRWSDSEAWDKIKQNWTKWKVISYYTCYCNSRNLRVAYFSFCLYL